jgi:hypothetical protein
VGDDAVVPAAQIDAYLARIFRLHAALQIRGIGSRRPHLDLEPLAGGAHVHRLGGVGQPQVQVTVEPPVEAPRHFRQVIAADPQGGGQPLAVEGGVRRGHARHRGRDHLIRHPRLDVGDDRLPIDPLEDGQDLTIVLPSVEGEPFEVGILRTEGHQLGPVVAGDGQEQPLVARERTVPVFGYRLPERLIGKPDPSPLPAMPIPVAEQEVDEPHAQEGTGIGAILGTRLETHARLVGGERGGRAREAGGGELLDGAEDVGEDLAELSEGGIVGHDDQRGSRHPHARGLEQLGGDDRGRRMTTRRLILHDAARDRSLQLGRQRRGGVLVERSEGIAPAVRAAHRQAPRLHAADAAHGRQPRRERREIEDLHLDGCGPERTVVGAEEGLVNSAGAVLGSGRDHPRLGEGRRRRERHRPYGPPPRRAHWVRSISPCGVRPS